MTIQLFSCELNSWDSHCSCSVHLLTRCRCYAIGIGSELTALGFQLSAGLTVQTVMLFAG
jgi:hypothetical protein